MYENVTYIGNSNTTLYEIYKLFTNISWDTSTISDIYVPTKWKIHPPC